MFKKLIKKEKVENVYADKKKVDNAIFHQLSSNYTFITRPQAEFDPPFAKVHST